MYFSIVNFLKLDLVVLCFFYGIFSVGKNRGCQVCTIGPIYQDLGNLKLAIIDKTITATLASFPSKTCNKSHSKTKELIQLILRINKKRESNKSEHRTYRH